MFVFVYIFIFIYFIFYRIKIVFFIDSTIFSNSLGGRTLMAIKLNDVFQNTHFGKNLSFKKEFSSVEIYGQTSLKAVYLKKPVPVLACIDLNGGCDHFCVQM